MKQQDAAIEPITTHELFVKRDNNGRWIVADKDGNTSPITAERNEEIRWNIKNEEAVIAFQFPRKDLFKEGDKWWWIALQSQPLELTVREEAPSGEHTYAVFCLLPDGNNLEERLRSEEIGYAEGGSPPSMIVPR